MENRWCRAHPLREAAKWDGDSGGGNEQPTNQSAGIAIDHGSNAS